MLVHKILCSAKKANCYFVMVLNKCSYMQNWHRLLVFSSPNSNCFQQMVFVAYATWAFPFLSPIYVWFPQKDIYWRMYLNSNVAYWAKLIDFLLLSQCKLHWELWRETYFSLLKRTVTESLPSWAHNLDFNHTHDKDDDNGGISILEIYANLEFSHSRDGTMEKKYLKTHLFK